MKKMMKFISFILVLTILMSILISVVNINTSYAVSQSVSSDINGINNSKYPGIKDRINLLKSKYPNWNFKILYTGLDWNDVIAHEFVGHGDSPKCLVQKQANYQGAWICPICGDRPYDNGTWRCCSEQAIKYMMDPRNSINASDVFQFEELNNTGCDIETIRTMVSGSFLAGHEQVLVNTANNNNVNGYYITARMLHEQGKSGSALTSGDGYEGNYVGYYNAFNIAASGNSTSEIIKNALAYAKKMGWNSLDKSITEGIRFLANEYINKGQNTLYLQKFDVEASNGLYCNQYMQNILAAQTEGTTLRNTYISTNTMSSAHTFIIPVYENMPNEACPRPDTNGTSTVSSDLVKVNVNSQIKMRNSPNGSETVGWLYKDEIVTRTEKATSKVAGTYWDKVRKNDGTEGYTARETYEYESEYKLYLVPINDNSANNNNNNNNNEQEEENNLQNTNKVKIDKQSNIIIVTPDAIANDILNANGGSIKIVRADGSYLWGPGEPLATGFKVANRYTVVKKGDCNGDSYVDTGDTFIIKKVLLNVGQFGNDYLKKAADVNNDNYVDTGDTFSLKKQLLGLGNISI